jgi:Glycine zipper
MKKNNSLSAAFAVVILASSLVSCVVPYDTAYGVPVRTRPGNALIGATTGAVAGSIIGNQSGRGLEGALLGGLIGGFAGSSLPAVEDRYYNNGYGYPVDAQGYGYSYYPQRSNTIVIGGNSCGPRFLPRPNLWNRGCGYAVPRRYNSCYY